MGQRMEIRNSILKRRCDERARWFAQTNALFQHWRVYKAQAGAERWRAPSPAYQWLREAA